MSSLSCHQPQSPTTEELPTWTFLSTTPSDDENVSTPAPSTPLQHLGLARPFSKTVVKPEPKDSAILAAPLEPLSKQGKQNKGGIIAMECNPLKRKISPGISVKTVTCSPDSVTIPPFGNFGHLGPRNRTNSKTQLLATESSVNQTVTSAHHTQTGGSPSLQYSPPEITTSSSNVGSGSALDLAISTALEPTKSSTSTHQILSKGVSSNSTSDPLLLPLANSDLEPPTSLYAKNTANVLPTAKQHRKEVFLGVFPPPRRPPRHFPILVSPSVDSQTDLVRALTLAFNANAQTLPVSPPRPLKKWRTDPSGLAVVLTAALAHNAADLSPTPAPQSRRIRPFVSVPARPKSPPRKDKETAFPGLFTPDESDSALDLFPEDEDEVEPMHEFIDRCLLSQVAPFRMEDIDWGIRMENDTLIQNLSHLSREHQTQRKNTNLPPRFRHIAVKEEPKTFNFLRTMYDSYGVKDVTRGGGSKPKVWKGKRAAYTESDFESGEDDEDQSDSDQQPEPSFKILPPGLLGRLRPRPYAQASLPQKPSASRREGPADDSIPEDEHRSSSVARHPNSTYASPPSTPSVANGTDGSVAEDGSHKSGHTRSP